MSEFHCSEKSFWEERYQNRQTGWDIGSCSPPLQTIFQQLSSRDLHILIPGAGNAYEAAWLHQHGFTHVHVLDFARQPINQFESLFPEFPKNHIHLEDFFLHQGKYDLIVEQTFFCALPPSMRESYAQKMTELLAPGGEVRGVLFNRDFENRPPFGGSVGEYSTLFSRYFQEVSFEPCSNSIPPRAGSEVIFRLSKPIPKTEIQP
jgi:methyl halide transferase